MDGKFDHTNHQQPNNRWRFFVVASFVFICHFLGVGALFFFSPAEVQKEKTQKVVVKTIRLHPPTEVKQLEVLPPVQEAIVMIEAETKVESIPLVEVVQNDPPKQPEIAPQKHPEPKHQEHPKPTPPEKKKPTPPPKPKPAPPKPVKKEPAPIKKPAPPPPKPVKKEPSKEEKAAKEAEIAKQKKIEEQRKAEEAKQKKIAQEKEAARQKRLELLSQAKDKMVQSNPSKPEIAFNSLSDTPKLIENLQIDALPTSSGLPELNAKEISYRDEVAYRLKIGLKLPDYGEIKIKLTLQKTGKVAQVQIVSSKSEKNKQYVEKVVPTLSFPSFGGQFDGASEYTFLITLTPS